MLSSSSGSEEITNTSSETSKTRSERLSSSSRSSLSSTPGTMEEVWKDINFSSLHENIAITSSDHHQPNTISPPPPPPNFPPNNLHRPNNFQDFFARPFSNTNDPNFPKTMVGSISSSMASPSPSRSPHSSLHHHHHHPVTALSLNSGPAFRLFDNPLHHHNHHHRDLLIRPHNITNPMNMMIGINNNNNNNNPFDSSPASFGKKRFPCDNISGGGGGGGSGERRHKRMIKNRESAARSRARKQAYTNELEIEIAHLLEENERLRKQHERFCQAAAAQLPKKHSLQRTSTAPF